MTLCKRGTLQSWGVILIRLNYYPSIFMFCTVWITWRGFLVKKLVWKYVTHTWDVMVLPEAFCRTGCLRSMWNCVLWWFNEDLTGTPWLFLEVNLATITTPPLTMLPLSVGENVQVYHLCLCWGFWTKTPILYLIVFP